jgi:hypothetical protein
LLNASTSPDSVTRRHRQMIRSEQMVSMVELAVIAKRPGVTVGIET